MINSTFALLTDSNKNMNITKLLIVKCEIEPYPRPMPKGMLDPMPQVKVRFDDGSEKILFEFYPDELSFTENEFIGLTEKQAHELRMKKDIEFLQS